MRLRVHTFNLLSTRLTSAHHPFQREFLRNDHRLRLVLRQLTDAISKGPATVFCLQEVGEECGGVG